MGTLSIKSTARAVLLAGATLCLSVATATAAELKIGLASEPTSIDPHFHHLIPNDQVTAHIFEALVAVGPDFSPRPGLATSWKAVSDTSWEFKLREGVKFHDGTAFDAADVVFSLCRVPTVQNSPSPFTIYTKSIAAVEVKDPYTLVLTTRAPYPLLVDELSKIGIISDGKSGEPALPFDPAGCKGIAQWPTIEDFNSGKAAVGTGPFKFAQYTKGEQIVLERNQAYWGKAPQWDKVTLRPLSNAGARVAALLAGDVDVIESPPIQDIPRLAGNPKLRVVQSDTIRVIYLHMDQNRDQVPGIVSTVAGNPFKNPLVREAVSLSIDRSAIVEKIMGGSATVANQLLPEGMFGYNPRIGALGRDSAKAKKLLAEAGYPNGFEVVLATPNDRYINDDKVAQAVAQMLTRSGIKTSVQSYTSSVFFSKRNAFEFGFYLAGWGSTGDMSSPLRALVATMNKEKGYGGTNQGRYSNPALDALIDEAMQTVDESKRRSLLQNAIEIAIKDFAVIPLHYEKRPWAMRRGLNYTPRTDERTYAFEITEN